MTRPYLRLLGYVRPYLPRLLTGAFFGAVFAGSSVGFLPMLNSSFARVFDYENVGLGRILLYASLLPALALVRGAGSYLSTYLVEWVGNRVVTDLRIEAYTHLQNLSVAYYDQNRSGEMISRTVNDTTLLQGAASTALADLVRQPLILLGAAGYIFWLDWRLALGSFVLFPLCVLPVFRFGRKVRQASTEGQERLADIVSTMQESIAGVRIVKAFSMEGHERDRFAGQCQAFFGRIMRVVRAKALVEPVVWFVSALGLVAALAYAASVKMPFEDFITFGLGLVLLYDPVKRMGRLHMNIQQSSAAAVRIFEILDTDVGVKEREDAEEFSGTLAEIRFERVSFSYGEGPTLTDVDLDVRAGERIAVVGSSGAGKTTLVNLLPRFFDVTEGRITMNGKDLRDLTLRSLRGLIGLVTQETVLFNETVANNIAYGSVDATRGEIEKAARRAHAHEFVSGFPDGYETVIGERGVRLSGGQRQRLAIARAILRDPPVLVLDEATSALDTESERMVQSAIDEVMAGRTVFAIAHRLSTVANCDRIIVLEGGRVVEQGTHHDLLAREGIYRRLYDLQFEEPGKGSK
ncbi:MAG: ABC transporter ATP-binding protein [Lentisphaerae bacterium]|nr:ABC transporter ATP-binding protein [Lentisphaerota bacterium]